ncbi:conserved hypothetical protein [Rippkaea orientalis PCC 8801]|uniref:DUF6883 domain-containing protein n=1 Tax=Rippkaea orientalis (strain PCC 8801 / RF-1) TaxID=41431 RepID=B7K391_RIPO1|nr:DUF6883 domain-containing protein [Rippkaea orientalis]ACK64411.1 conserved hypothetical protein [Rippkaea orientalis PCC 8801]
MQIPPNAIIPQAKLTEYLLKYKTKNDKSQYLSQAGFTQDNPEQLKIAIYELIQTNRGIKDGENEYGIFYKVSGELIGINRRNLSVITIWLQRKIDNQFQFITLKPNKEKTQND